jgi:hypothetical protein
MIFPGFPDGIIEIASVESSEQALSSVLAVSEFPRVRNLVFTDRTNLVG